jgi:hypothetical protein
LEDENIIDIDNLDTEGGIWSDEEEILDNPLEDDTEDEEEEEVNRFKYGVNSLEEFEQLLEFKDNDKIKSLRAKTPPTADI